MNVQHIVARRFMCHKTLDVKLPDRGLVLVTGSNGVGKSSLIETIAWTVWGKTLRGTNPGKHADVALTTVEFGAHRNGKSLQWAKPGEQPTTYENATKAREALESLVGTRDLWQRASVFSSHDAATFSSATDAQRKRLLEQLAGVAHFDAALKTCREELREHNVQHALSTGAVSHAEQSLGMHRARLADLQQQPTDAVDTAATREAYTKVCAAYESIQRDLDADRAAQLERTAKLAQCEERVRAASKRARRVADGFCPLCGQAVCRDLLDELRGRATKAARVAAAVAEARNIQTDCAAVHREEVQAELAEMREAMHDMRDGMIAAETAWGIADSRAETAKVVQSAIESAKADLEMNRTQLDATKHELTIAQACEQVLGLRGVRVRVLGQLLGAIESATNAYLAEMAPPAVSIRLKPYTQRKSGKVASAISMDVQGVGGEQGYKAASGGERRRIDAACMLALADLASAAYGRTPGTLWMDEVFDALDPAGVAGVSGTLERMAQDRAVVVITHSPELVSGLPTPAAQLEF
jgi:DNA repair exonuclease SbcCD ATPase subunit